MWCWVERVQRAAGPACWGCRVLRSRTTSAPTTRCPRWRGTADCTALAPGWSAPTPLVAVNAILERLMTSENEWMAGRKHRGTAAAGAGMPHAAGRKRRRQPTSTSGRAGESPGNALDSQAMGSPEETSTAVSWQGCRANEAEELMLTPMIYGNPGSIPALLFDSAPSRCL